MKWNELVRIAKEHGWIFDKHGSNHDIYKHPDRTDKMIVDRHGSEEIKPGLFKKLKKQIGF